METITMITNDEIKALWAEVFPKSMMLVSKACMGDSHFFTGKLAANREESAHRILENDALQYMFEIDGDKYHEIQNSLYIKPDPITQKYLCYGRSDLRKKTIKGVTAEKLLKRFKEVKDHVIANKENFKDLLFNINDKLAA